MIPKLQIKSLEDIVLITNSVIIKNITDSIEDYQRQSNLIVVRNDANNKRERALGTVIKSSKDLYIGMGKSRVMVSSSDIIDENVIYDCHGRMYEIELDNDDSTYYLVRFPDVIAIAE